MRRDPVRIASLFMPKLVMKFVTLFQKASEALILLRVLDVG